MTILNKGLSLHHQKTNNMKDMLSQLEGKEVTVRLNTPSLSIQLNGTLHAIYGHDIYTVHQGKNWANFRLSQVFSVSPDDAIIGIVQS